MSRNSLVPVGRLLLCVLAAAMLAVAPAAAPTPLLAESQSQVGGVVPHSTGPAHSVFDERDYDYDRTGAPAATHATKRTGVAFGYDTARHLARVDARGSTGSSATKGGSGGTTRLYRSVDEDELADIQASSRYTTGRGQEGKPFYPSEEQASRFSRQMYPKTGRPQTVTSIEVPLDLLRGAERFFPAREGPALFLRQLPRGRPTIHNSSRR